MFSFAVFWSILVHKLTLCLNPLSEKHHLITRVISSTIHGTTPCNFHSSLSLSLTIKSLFSDYYLELDADIVSKISYEVSPKLLQYIYEIQPKMELADCLLTSSAIVILIDGTHASKILLRNKVFIRDLCFEKTCFGWVIEGPPRNLNSKLVFCLFCSVWNTRE